MAIKEQDARTWFHRADCFHYTSLFLGQTMTQAPQMQFVYSYPHITLKAFAAEAYLKCLLMLEGKTAPQTHHLLSLFHKLEPESQKTIKRWWDKESKPSLKKLKKQGPTPGLKVPLTLREALDQSATAFVDWRYAGEGSEIAFTIMAFPLFVRRRILENEPSWAHHPPHPLAYLNSEPGDDRV